MAWYAKIESNIVTQVIFVVEHYDSTWLYREYGGEWLRCEEGDIFRNVFPSIGFTYNIEEDKFYPPKPYASWIYDLVIKNWKPPISKTKRSSRWDEETLSWIDTQ